MLLTERRAAPSAPYRSPVEAQALPVFTHVSRLKSLIYKDIFELKVLKEAKGYLKTPAQAGFGSVQMSKNRGTQLRFCMIWRKTAKSANHNSASSNR